jgi:hypothetical protein
MSASALMSFPSDRLQLLPRPARKRRQKLDFWKCHYCRRDKQKVRNLALLPLYDDSICLLVLTPSSVNRSTDNGLTRGAIDAGNAISLVLSPSASSTSLPRDRQSEKRQ